MRRTNPVRDLIVLAVLVAVVMGWLCGPGNGRHVAAPLKPGSRLTVCGACPGMSQENVIRLVGGLFVEGFDENLKLQYLSFGGDDQFSGRVVVWMRNGTACWIQGPQLEANGQIVIRVGDSSGDIESVMGPPGRVQKGSTEPWRPETLYYPLQRCRFALSLESHFLSWTARARQHSVELVSGNIDYPWLEH